MICYIHGGTTAQVTGPFCCSVCDTVVCNLCHAIEQKKSSAELISTVNVLTPIKIAPEENSETHQRSQQSQDSTKKRRRLFLESWRNEYFWLDHRNGLMFCNVCTEYDSTGPFITGCNSFRKDNIRAHDNSTSHKMNIVRWSEGLNKLDNIVENAEVKLEGKTVDESLF